MLPKKSTLLMFLVLVTLCEIGVIEVLVQADYINAQVIFTPDSVALEENHDFFEANITLPNPYSVGDIFTASVMLENVISPTAWTFVTTSVYYTPTAVYDKCGETSPNVASRVIDCRTDCYWKHDATENHWIILDMGKTMNVSGIQIYQSSTNAYHWGLSNGIEVYVSNDTSSWHSMWNGTLDADYWQKSGTFSVTGRYVKLYSRSNNSFQRLYEIQVQVEIPIELVLRFDGSAVMDYIRSAISHEGVLVNPAEVELTVSGELLNGTPFMGEDIIMVTTK